MELNPINNVAPQTNDVDQDPAQKAPAGDPPKSYQDDPSQILADFREGTLDTGALGDQWTLLQLQDQMAQESLTLSLLSQMIAAEHDTYRSIIGNIRA